VSRDANHVTDIFARDLKTHRTKRISVGRAGREANAASYSPVISRNGRYVAFLSSARNLVADDTNGRPDVFVVDLQSGGTDRVSLSSAGTQGDLGALNGILQFTTLRPPYVAFRPPGVALSDDGRYVAFLSRSTNLVPGDLNGKADAFVRDLRTKTTERVSISSSGAESDQDSDRPLLSGDGQTVVFATLATNLADQSAPAGAIIAHDRRSGATALAVTGTGGDPLRVRGQVEPLPLAITPDGRYFVFQVKPSKISSTPSSKRQVILADRLTNMLELVSVSSRGELGTNTAGILGAAISADAKSILFSSNSQNLGRRRRAGRGGMYIRTLAALP
jgi:Tol biopolymer transport system component